MGGEEGESSMKESGRAESGGKRERSPSEVAADLSALDAAEKAMFLAIPRRGRQKAPRKVPVSIRLAPEVVAGLRATGPGWQGRAEQILRWWLEAGRR